MGINDAAIGKVARLRDFVPINRGAGVPVAGVLSSYVLPGVDWNYFRVFYRNLGLATRWPDGLSAHASWESRDGWRSIYLWDENLTADRYFGSVGVEAVTNTVRALGTAQGPTGTTDVEPLRLAVREWVLGMYAGAFSEIEEDPDGEAIDKLGVRPVIVELDLPADPDVVISALDVEKRVPRDLIARVVAEHTVGTRMLQIWTGEEIARAALETDLLPALEKAGVECDVDPAESILELRVLAVANGAAEAFGHPPAIEL